ncbi:peptidyl-prolyl cis-trans isomerase FKBP8 [Macrosteles quadrilineatus]|uniref:peptidyl-prolyl cis-trans isomerase FKBP8 n=1 Tax=Macrosteles quadrilineatus TaxID=74068 RepID=UPI0023E18796|nr:peptidyl-prolyl cis-trans isomerase FKBP8 [Macrosteles quadrilineatus]
MNLEGSAVDSFHKSENGPNSSSLPSNKDMSSFTESKNDIEHVDEARQNGLGGSPTDIENEPHGNSSEDEEREQEWLDILGSGQLLKKVIKKGLSDSRPQRSDVCTVRYVGKYEDKVVDEGNVTINLGDGEVIQGLDFTLPLMDLEEEAEVKVGPRFAFGSEGRAPDIPPDATLYYTVTLVSAEPEPLIETLPLKQRKEIGNRKKERGNYWYTRKDHTLAIQCYRRALEYLDDHGLSAENQTEPEEEIHSLLEDRIKVYNNLAAAQLKIKAFEAALQSVENVLRCQPENVKALFRKGKIMAEKGETEEAVALLRKALTIEPENSQTRNELNQLLAKQKKDIDLQKNLYKKMLGTNKAKEDEPPPNNDAKLWGVLVGAVGALVSVFVAYKWYKPV